MPDIAEPVVTSDYRSRPAVRRGEAGGHIAHGMWMTRADVVRGQLAGRSVVFQGRDICGRDIRDVYEIPALAAILENPRCLATLQRGAEDRRDPGVRRIARHSRPVHIVIAQRDDAAAGHPRPRCTEMFLREFACGVGVSGIQRGILWHLAGAERRAAHRASRLEFTVPKVRLGPWTGPYDP